MQAPSVAQRTLVVLLAVLLLVLSGGMAWAAVNDYTARARVPEGVTLAGQDISGMTSAELRALIAGDVSDRLTRPVTVVADGREFTFDPTGAISVDEDAMVAAAFEPRRNAAFVARLRHDLLATPLPADVEPVYAVDQNMLDEWTAGVADSVNSKSVNAKVLVDVNMVKVRPSKTGRRVETTEAASVLEQTLTSDDAAGTNTRRISVPVKVLQPKKTEDEIGRTIVVDLSERRVRLFDGAKLVKTYPCAIGTPSHPTPAGEWKITLKRYRPTWVNPGSAWAVDMPKSIPPGPGNPLGTRAINLDASGIRFHGTENIRSVGTAASHGCMRMYRSHIEDLFERVEVGDKVFVVR